MERGCRHRSEQARSRVRSDGTKLSHCVLIRRSLDSLDSCGLQHAAIVQPQVVFTSRSARSRKPIPAYEDNVPVFVVPTLTVKNWRAFPTLKRRILIFNFECSKNIMYERWNVVKLISLRIMLQIYSLIIASSCILSASWNHHTSREFPLSL